MSSNYDADIYHLFSGTSSIKGDIDWYLELARKSGGEVLELGAGTGRTLLPLAREGIHVTGIEYDAGMLDKLREVVAEEPDGVQARVTLHQGDMRDFALEKRDFAMIQIPFRAFLHCLTHDTRLATLRHCHAHLEPGGRIALNVFFPSLAFMSQNQGAHHGIWRMMGEQEGEDGDFYQRSEMTTYDTVAQRLSARLRTEHFDARGVLQRTTMERLELAYLYPQDLHALLSEVGFVDIEIDPDFAPGTLTSEHQEVAIKALKKG